jgi:hypothetical protein
VFVQDNTAYVGASTAGLRVLNVSDPSQPNEIAVLETAGPSTTAYEGPGRVQGIELEGNNAYVTLTEQGLGIIDVADSQSPEAAGLWESPGPIASLTRGIDVEGDHAYVLVSQSGLHILDLTNPAQPTEVGFYQPVRLMPDSADETEDR